MIYVGILSTFSHFFVANFFKAVEMLIFWLKKKKKKKKRKKRGGEHTSMVLEHP
jgi:hypothetical protein